MKKIVAFTLIELLVVIAIIGILSGLIVVVMGGMTQKATTAKAQVFSNSLRNSLMLNLISEWKLDEGSGYSIIDSWNGGNACTLKEDGFVGTCGESNCPQWQETDCISGKCLSFDGSNDYLDCGANNNLLPSSAITVGAWVKPNNPTISFGTVLSKDGLETYRLYVTDKGTIRWRVNATSNYNVDTTEVISKNNTVWSYIVATYDSSLVVNHLKVYINGVLSKQGNGGGNIVTGINNFYMGALYGNISGYAFKGSIDDVRIYSAAMPSSQIKEQYYMGLNKLLGNGGITRQEYQQRIAELENKTARE